MTFAVQLTAEEMAAAPRVWVGRPGFKRLVVDTKWVTRARRKKEAQAKADERAREAAAARETKRQAKIAKWYRQAHARIQGVGPTLPLPRFRVLISDIVDAVAEVHDIEPIRLSSSRYTRSLVDARAHVVVLARQAGYSLADIGRALGGLDHNTINRMIASWPERAARLGITIDHDQQAGEAA